ncbi:hypothetical protein [Desulfogranum japonicum]|uniref:hypothetical protein n=1 Tax=Desulfogranum japonicum TaxID=231447 RepID=UPI000406C661|nr:hypothetical protein [Desulfogranum japonicum]
MVKAVQGEFTAKDLSSQKKGSKITDFLLLFGLATLFLNTIGKISKVLGAIVGAIALPIIAMLSFMPGALILILFAVAGAFYGYFIGSLFTLPTVSSSRHSGWISGGGSPGGFGGGFSGGGGGFGGGGASGGW